MNQIFDIVEELEKERKKNKQLKELCDKYEEEHKTTFEIWQKDIKANKKAIDTLEKRINKIENQEWKSYTGQTDEEYLEEQEELLDILKGDNK